MTTEPPDHRRVPAAAPVRCVAAWLGAAVVAALAACTPDPTPLAPRDGQDADTSGDGHDEGDSRPEPDVASDATDGADSADSTDSADTADSAGDAGDGDASGRDTTGSDTADGDSTAPAMRLHVLDVGQGEAIIVELPCGAMLIDTGGEATAPSAGDPGFDSVLALETQVRAFFTTRPDLHATFDLVVLTHPHIDHTRGVPRLLELAAAGELTIKNVVTNGDEGSASGAAEQRALHDFADASPAVGRWYVLQRKVGAGGLVNEVIDPLPACTTGGVAVDPRVTALWGRVDDQAEVWATWSDDDRYNDNNHSVVLRIDFGDASVLLPGDLEEAGIAALVTTFAGTGLLDVDVYKAGHHGSHNGTTGALVNAMTPRAAVISAGPATRVADWTAWAYGHPRWSAVSDMLGDGDSVGVSDDRRAAIDAPVASYYADGHGVFETRHIEPAVYCTGWEGAGVVVTLRADGGLELP